MGQKSSSKMNNKKGAQVNDAKAFLQASIKNKLKEYNNTIRQKIENNYTISNFNSNTYLAYNIKKKVDTKSEEKFTWFEYAEDECELIYSQKPYTWVEQTLRLLQYMKKDAKVREFQKNQIVSLIYTIETMTELDYLVDVPMEQYEDFFPEEELDEIVEGQINEINKTIKIKNLSVFGSGIHNLDGSNRNSNSIKRDSSSSARSGNEKQGYSSPVNIVEYNDKASPLSNEINRSQAKEDCKVSMFNSQEDIHNENNTIIQMQRRNTKNSVHNNNEAGDPKNIRTLIEKTPIFEEELEENIQGTKIDTNLMRSEVFTMMADQGANNILQYHAVLEQRQQIRERHSAAITQMNNNTLLLNNAAVVAQQESQQNQNINQSAAQNLVGNSAQQTAPEENDIYTDALKMVNFYKRISLFLERSLEEKMNGLRALMKLYKKYFMKQYSEILGKHQLSGKMEVKESLVDEMLKDIQQFTHFFLYCVIFFYDLDNLLPQKRHSSLVNKENLWNFLVNVIFADNEIYTLCFELIQVSLIEKERSLQMKMINLEKVLPHHLEIDPKFCLNNKTIEWAKQQQQKKLQKKQSEALNISSPSSTSNQYLQIPSTNLNTTPIIKNNSQSPITTKVYESPPITRSRNQQSAAPSVIKNQLEMLEEESEFVFNENSRHSSALGQTQRAQSEIEQYQTIEIIAEDKENVRSQQKSINCSTIKSNGTDTMSESQVVQKQDKQCNSNNENLKSQNNKEETQTREKRILSTCKQDKSLQYLDPYRISLQDTGKDEILEDTCIPKISMLDEKDNDFLQPAHIQKSPNIKISPPKPQSPRSERNSNNSGNSKNNQPKYNTPAYQDIRLTQSSQYSTAFRHQAALMKTQRTSSLDEKCPYYKAIKKLKNLTYYNSPVHKMKLLVQCFELIPECVSEFYSQNIDQEYQNLIASDDLINILVFIVLKSKCTQINSHLKFISSFLSKSTQQSKIGYYCTTLQIVCGYLESDRIYENVESLRTKSEYFNQTLLQMNTSFLRKSSFHQNIEITSVSNLNKIISNEKLDNHGSNNNTIINNNCSNNNNASRSESLQNITVNIFENVTVV